MFDNPNSGSNSMQEAVEKMKSNREAVQPDPVDVEATGGTEEAQPHVEETQQPDNFQLEAEQDGVQEATESESSEAPQRYTVKVGGEEKEVSLDELQSGYMMHSDYTKKTMAHSENVKEFEAKQAQFDQERAAKLQELESFIEQQDKAIDWDSLRDSDPEEFIRLKELQETRKEAAAKERSELEAKQQAQMQQYVASEAAKLTELMGPTWVDDKRVKDLDSATNYLQSKGFSDQEVHQLIDSRMWLVAFDAMRYQELQGTKERVSKEVKDAPKSVKPGQKRPEAAKTEVDKARAALINADKFTSDQAAVNLLKARRGK